MRRISTIFLVVVLLPMAACQRSDLDWFAGDFDEALAAASTSRTLVMVDFYTDWCTWCKHLDKDTFSDAAVQAELAGLVAIKVNAEKGGKALAARFKIDGYPTVVFTDGAGVEVDRLVGYFPPDKFISEVRRIRAGPRDS